MADFKIKPAAGTGNKLILESEDGTDVLTTSASGVTLASATLTAPTLTGVTTAGSIVLTPGSAPATTEGAMYYDSTDDVVKIYNGSEWRPISEYGPIVSATGGNTVATIGAYKIHTFTSNEINDLQR